MIGIPGDTVNYRGDAQIFSAMLLASGGLALLVPNFLALAAFVAILIAIEIQVRTVEEPYLLRTQGAAYARYGAEVGRFLPRIGLFRQHQGRSMCAGTE